MCVCECVCVCVCVCVPGPHYVLHVCVRHHFLSNFSDFQLQTNLQETDRLQLTRLDVWTGEYTEECHRDI